MNGKELSLESRDIVSVGNVYQSKEAFDTVLRGASALSRSTLVPKLYQGSPENCFIAVDMANRMGLSPMIVMQNLYVVQGSPSWAGQACTMLIKNCGEFRNIRHVYTGEPGNDHWGCHVEAIRIKEGVTVKGATVTIATAKAEGWYDKNGSKWKTMPELMLAYRASAWFARVHCPESLMGMSTVEESEDIPQSRENERERLDSLNVELGLGDFGHEQ